MKRWNVAALLLALLFAVMPLLGCTESGEIDPELLEQAGAVLDILLEEGAEDAPYAAAPEGDLQGVETEGADGDDAADAPGGIEYGTRCGDPERVALYLHTYDELPPNFITKDDAKALGWNSAEGNLWDVTDGMSIGGDRFGNREGLLPRADGRVWYECDVNYEGGFRGAERIVFSNDGLIYYTNDHYASFTLMYGED